MCHCFQSVENMTEDERAEVLAEHSEDELRTELSPDALQQLGIAV